MDLPADDSLLHDSKPSATLSDVLARTLPQLRCFVGKRLGRRLAARETISDVVQSAAREVLEDLGGAQPGSSTIRRNLFVAATRKVAEHGRRHSAERRTPDREADPSEVTRLATGERGPNETAAIRDEIARIERALRELRADDRDVIVLAILVGMSHAEIARELGSSEGATRSRLSRALARLSARLTRGDHNDASSNVR
jgi:RNA polymerase sigma-70 factor (ECF subfamily)